MNIEKRLQIEFEFLGEEQISGNTALKIINNVFKEAQAEQLILSGVSQQRELLELVTEIANSKQVYSNTRHKLWAKKLISSNCG
tara:strand:+ start:274 stop:525 length:252 start_codon:yes stop_codon:yes gene_type:complete